MKRWLTQDLATLTGGSGRRAALVLVVAHVVPALLAWPLWAFGLHPYFDDRHWIPTALVVTYSAVVVLGTFIRFGVWGTPATSGRDSGEEYMQTFSPGLGFALGWLRWAMQLVMVFIIIIPTVMTWTNVRWWHIAGTDELDDLPVVAETIPVPQEWTLTDTEASRTGFPDFVLMSGPEGPEPEGYVELTYTVPASYTFEDLKQWLDSPRWRDAPDGDAFGAIQRERCDAERARCDVRRVPPQGREPEYFVRVELREPRSRFDQQEVEIRLDYRAHAAPDYEVSEETVERAMSIPAPSDWTRYDVLAEETNSGEDFTQFYGVPDSFGREDLEDWLDSDAWTDPATGPPFGRIRVDSPCREAGADGDRYLCSAMVVGTERSADTSYDGPVESLTVSLTADHTVRVSLERNG